MNRTWKILIILQFVALSIQAQDKFHFVFVGRTDDPNLKASIRADRDIADSLFTYIQGAADILNLQTHFITGANYNKTYVENFINTLPVDTTDVIFTIIDNHGFRLRGLNSRFPLVDFPGRSRPSESAVSLKRIHDLLVQKNGRLVMTFGVMCNQLPEGNNAGPNVRSPRIQSYLPTENVSTALLPQNHLKPPGRDSLGAMIKLFHRGRGQVLINAADRSEWTYYNLKDGFQYGSWALISFFKELAQLRSVVDNRYPVEILSQLLTDTKVDYEQTVADKMRKRVQINDQGDLLTASTIIYEGMMDSTYFEHTMGNVQIDSTVVVDPCPPDCPPPPCDANTILADVQNGAVKHLISLFKEFARAGYRSNKSLVMSYFENNNTPVDLVSGINSKRKLTVPIERYYDRYLKSNVEYDFVQISPENNASSFSIQGSPYQTRSDSVVSEYEVMVRFEQIFIGARGEASDADRDKCIEYKDITTKEARVAVTVREADCQVIDYAIQEIVLADRPGRSIACLPSGPEIIPGYTRRPNAPVRQCPGYSCP